MSFPVTAYNFLYENAQKAIESVDQATDRSWEDVIVFLNAYSVTNPKERLSVLYICSRRFLMGDKNLEQSLIQLYDAFCMKKPPKKDSAKIVAAIDPFFQTADWQFHLFEQQEELPCLYPCRACATQRHSTLSDGDMVLH